MNYKNLNTGEVISRDCYYKLPYEKQVLYTACNSEPTHFITSDNDGDSFISTAITAAEIMAIDDSMTTPEVFNDSPQADTGTDFGGGDFGGGGASSDF